MRDPKLAHILVPFKKGFKLLHDMCLKVGPINMFKRTRAEPSNTSYFPFDSDIVVMAAIMNVESPDRRTQNLRDRLNRLEYYSERV